MPKRPHKKKITSHDHEDEETSLEDAFECIESITMISGRDSDANVLHVPTAVWAYECGPLAVNAWMCRPLFSVSRDLRRLTTESNNDSTLQICWLFNFWNVAANAVMQFTDWNFDKEILPLVFTIPSPLVHGFLPGFVWSNGSACKGSEREVCYVVSPIPLPTMDASVSVEHEIHIDLSISKAD